MVSRNARVLTTGHVFVIECVLRGMRECVLRLLGSMYADVCVLYELSAQ